ncbi:hypothetical protein L1987_53087 [Smallanthus sonchifolius]|uniref:Uncharacterized protein n=1 Tax=Smallanthus sonchifolius TaxID=185202 RepID=A0ACB9EVQ2_9ASTR|nr:hypothetical protein L1987_53087 [Smallanthus sonchifolius]
MHFSIHVCSSSNLRHHPFCAPHYSPRIQRPMLILPSQRILVSAAKEKKVTFLFHIQRMKTKTTSLPHSLAAEIGSFSGLLSIAGIRRCALSR